MVLALPLLFKGRVGRGYENMKSKGKGYIPVIFKILALPLLFKGRVGRGYEYGIPGDEADQAVS
jgi:hypothetical protein